MNNSFDTNEQGRPIEPEIINEAPVNAGQPDPGKSYGIWSLVLGIVTYTCSCCFCGLGFIFSAIGLALGIVAYRKSKDAGITNAFAIAGIIICAFGILSSIVSTILTLISGGIGALSGLFGGDFSGLEELLPHHYY